MKIRSASTQLEQAMLTVEGFDKLYITMKQQLIFKGHKALSAIISAVLHWSVAVIPRSSSAVDFFPAKFRTLF